jgi:hypothetical protein
MSVETELVEGEDFYREGAAIVFTARFHLRRGYCCRSGCRHCPFDDARAAAGADGVRAQCVTEEREDRD